MRKEARVTIADSLQETALWTVPELVSITPHAMEEHRLLQIQDVIEEENRIGTGTMIKEAPSHNADVRILVAPATQDDTLIMNLGPAKPATILTMPCHAHVTTQRNVA